MVDIKLARLPDRTPVKVAISLDPDLHRLLTDYAAFYAAQHGHAAALADLVPAMLESFALGDKAFVRARREGRLNK